MSLNQQFTAVVMGQMLVLLISAFFVVSVDSIPILPSSDFVGLTSMEVNLVFGSEYEYGIFWASLSILSSSGSWVAILLSVCVVLRVFGADFL